MLARGRQWWRPLAGWPWWRRAWRDREAAQWAVAEVAPPGAGSGGGCDAAPHRPGCDCCQQRTPHPHHSPIKQQQ